MPLREVLFAFALLNAQEPLSPTAITAAPDGKSLWIACATGRRLLEFDLATLRTKRHLELPERPTGLAVTADGSRIYVTCAAPVSQVVVVESKPLRIAETLAVGHTAMAPVLSPDGKLLFVCNRFNNDVSIIDLAARRTVRRVAVEREPVAAAVTPNGKFLLVANHLHNGRVDGGEAAASVSVIDILAARVVKHLRLPNGSGALMDLRVSPDGRYAAVTHILAHFNVPTTQLERGWMNSNAVTLIDAEKLTVVGSVLLDGPVNGAANPWGLAWSADGKRLLATHAGAHEVSITDVPGLLAKLTATQTKADIVNDLSFLTGLRQTVRLPDTDRGPRSVAVVGNQAYTANYFSDTLSVINLSDPLQTVRSVALGPKIEAGLVRRGEEYFHDASYCFQHWQSCATCHPGDARTDALAWDLLNDGIGNPKKTKSMLLAHETPPAMSLGVRETAETAVRSGFQHIQYTRPPGAVAAAVDAYLRSLKPVPSPHLVNGQLAPAALRGREIFRGESAGCAKCHPEGLFTNMQPYDVGTAGGGDKRGEKLDTPTLVEVWRTAPYLHDGSARTMRDVLTVRNPSDKHGKTSHLSARQVADLIEYILSL